MENNVSFDDEWNELQKKRQRLIKQSEQLNTRRAGLAEEPEIVQMHKEESRLSEDAKCLQSEIHDYDYAISQRMSMIRNCQLVLAGRQSQAALNRTRNNFLKEVEREAKKIKKRRSPILRAALQLASETRQSMAMPLSQLLEYFKLQNTFDERSKQHNYQRIGELHLHIERLKENSRQTEKCLKEESQRVKKRGETHYQEILDWITQDRQHLIWTLEKDPSYKSAGLGCWQKRWPDDHLEGTPYALKQTSVQQNGHPYLGREKADPLPELPNQSAVNCPKPWEFFLVRRNGDLETMSLEISEFSKQMKPYLKHDLGGLKPESIYNKLIYPIIIKGADPRQLDIEPLHGDGLSKWDNLGIRGDYRIAVLIQDDDRQIWFFPYARKNQPF